MDVLLKELSPAVSKRRFSLNCFFSYNLKFLHLRCFQTKISQSSCKQETVCWLQQPPTIPLKHLGWPRTEIQRAGCGSLQGSPSC